ncbi:acetate--CoA ligase family protein [Microbacterium aurum]
MVDPTLLATQRNNTHGLDALLRPTRLAMVGASDKNLFSRRSYAQHRRLSRIPVTLVNPRTPEVHGEPTVQSCLDIDGGIDFALLLTPQAVTIDALRDAAAAGARGAAVMSQGWAEEGEGGRKQQSELIAVAEDLGITLLGPNHLGFANLWDGVSACALGLDLPVDPGTFALVSQSGAVGSALVGYAARHDVKFSFVVTTGNEAMIAIADVVDYLVDDEHTSAIGVFAETIRHPDTFLRAARRAADRGKAVVMLKAGSSELAAETARAHTGALVGDDRVIDAVLRQEGVIRVRSLEDLITVGNLAASTGRLKKTGVGILSVSGGACDLIADRGQEVGLELPTLSAEVNAGLAELLPSYGHPQNPLDVTGGALSNPEVWRRGIELMAQQEEIGLIGVVTSLPREGEGQRDATFEAVGDALRSTGLPGAIFPQIDQEQSEYVREVKHQAGITNVLPSVDRFVVAAAQLGRWSNWLADREASPRPSLPVSTAAAPAAGAGPRPVLSEHGARDIVAHYDVPLVPATLATTVEQSIAAARKFPGPSALKLCSPDVAHKTELGGVILNVVGDDAVAEAFRTLVKRADGAAVELEGVLVSPMRASGLELLVGVSRDADWGLVLAVAFGGAMVELLDDSALRVLPVSKGDVRQMLSELRGSRLLDGFRGSEPVDVDSVCDAILAVATAAIALGPDLQSLEVNPLLVTGERVEGLDVLISFA